MTGKDQTSKLRKENERLKSELEEMKEQVKVLSDKIHESTRSPLSHTSVTEAEASSSLEFIGKQYDEMEAFKHQALRDINAITIKLGKMEAKCDEINACIQRRNVNKLQASDLGFADHVSLAQLGLYDHLSPRLQNLLYEVKRVKVEQHFKFCWAKNGAVFLRKTDTSRIIKIKSMDDLTDLQDDDS